MKKFLLSVVVALFASVTASAEVINIQGTDYQTDVLIDRDLGPGVNYKRLRIPDFPLNVNMITMDLKNPYNRIETTQGGEQLGKTEKLADAYKRQYTAEKRPLAGANGNFWVVRSQYPWAEFLVGATFNGNVRNGEIITETNAHADWWGHNNGSPGCVAISPDKNMMIDFMFYKGWVVSEKFDSLVIQQTNKLVRDNEVGLYNHFFGRSKSFIPADQYSDENGTQRMRRVENVSTEVYLTINEGNEWMVGRKMQCTVQEVKTDAGAGTLGDYDLCLVGRGVNKDALASLVAGDQVVIDLGWELPDGSRPEIEQLIGGNGVVMVDGELTTLNQIDDYNTKTYSRCAYGTTADRKTMINVVIDMATDLVYGQSKGCNTLVMCDIMKHYGCTNIMNMDAGGSAQMMVNGEVVNRTTEGTPRAVANGWFFYSIAPQDDVITRLEFDEVALKTPIYASYQPKVLGYNQYGDLIDEDVQGFTLSCESSIGSCDGMTFIAGGIAGSGNITATLNGVSVTKSLEVLNADIAIRIQPTILIDATRQYPMEVTATVGQNIYGYDPSHIEWTVADETIATINENGVLQGLKEGTTQIIGQIGEYRDTTSVAVEIAGAAMLYPTDFTGWTLKSPSGISNRALSEDGIYSFTYGSPRGTSVYLKMTKQVRYYSLPDHLWLTFTSSLPLTSIDVDLRSPQDARANNVSITPAESDTFAVNQEYRVEIPIETPEDLIKYPLTLNGIKFNIPAKSSNKGEQAIKISEISAEYANYTSVENVIADKVSAITIYPNPSVGGVFTVSSSQEIECVEVYSISGKAMVKKVGNGSSVTIDSQLLPGVYVVSVKTASATEVSKLIVK